MKLKLFQSFKFYELRVQCTQVHSVLIEHYWIHISPICTPHCNYYIQLGFQNWTPTKCKLKKIASLVFRYVLVLSLLLNECLSHCAMCIMQLLNAAKVENIAIVSTIWFFSFLSRVRACYPNRHCQNIIPIIVCIVRNDLI